MPKVCGIILRKIVQNYLFETLCIERQNKLKNERIGNGK